MSKSEWNNCCELVWEADGYGVVWKWKDIINNYLITCFDFESNHQHKLSEITFSSLIIIIFIIIIFWFQLWAFINSLAETLKQAGE
jgi:hypothetical protein